MTARFSMGEVDNPTQETIVKGFHKYTRAAISPQGKIPKETVKKKREISILASSTQLQETRNNYSLLQSQ